MEIKTPGFPRQRGICKTKTGKCSAVKIVMLPGGTHFIPWTKKKDITAAMVEMLK